MEVDNENKLSILLFRKYTRIELGSDEMERSRRTCSQLRGHVVADLCWVDLAFECSTVCPILPGLIGNLSEEARQVGKMVEHRYPSQPNPGPRPDGPLYKDDRIAKSQSAATPVSQISNMPLLRSECDRNKI